jgi:hypothetical protein
LEQKTDITARLQLPVNSKSQIQPTRKHTSYQARSLYSRTIQQNGKSAYRLDQECELGLQSEGSQGAVAVLWHARGRDAMI